MKKSEKYILAWVTVSNNDKYCRDCYYQQEKENQKICTLFRKKLLIETKNIIIEPKVKKCKLCRES